MRALTDSIIDIYQLVESDKDNRKELIIENALAKVESKTRAEVNEFGKRTYSEVVNIHFDRKTIKEIDINNVEWGTFLINRKEITSFNEEVDEWYKVSSVLPRANGNTTIVLETNRTATFTDTNNFSGFKVIG